MINNKHTLLGLRPHDWHQGYSPPAPWTAGYGPGTSVHLVARPQLAGRIGALWVDRRDADHWSLDDLRLGKNSMSASSAPMPMSQFAVRAGLLDQLADVAELPMGELGTRGVAGPGVGVVARPLFDLGVAPIAVEIGLIATNISTVPRQLRAALLLTVRDDMPERVPGSAELPRPGELVAPCQRCDTRDELYVIGTDVLWCRGCGSARVDGTTRVPTVLRALRGAW